MSNTNRAHKPQNYNIYIKKEVLVSDTDVKDVEPKNKKIKK